LYSNLRFVASASLVALASVVGVLALYPDALEELLVASAEISDPPAACQQQDWWQLDRSCLSRRGMPWVAASPESNAVAVPSAAEGAPEQPLTDNRSVATAPVESPQRSEVTAPQQETPALPPIAEERQIPTQRSEVAASPQETPALPPVAEERQIPTQRSEAAAPPQETPAPAPLAEEQHIGEQRKEAAAPQQETSPSPPVVGERHIPKPRREVMAPRRETPPAAEGRRVPKPAAEAQPRAAAPKKPAPEERAAKQRPTNEALNAVRRFQDDLRDIPVSAYAADGTRRTIVIRPTSIQDVYYYSAPR
jgi:hypothetical protein